MKTYPEYDPQSGQMVAFEIDNIDNSNLILPRIIKTLKKIQMLVKFVEEVFFPNVLISSLDLIIVKNHLLCGKIREVLLVTGLAHIIMRSQSIFKIWKSYSKKQM